MSKTNLYAVRLIKGFSHTADGITFYQNKIRKMHLTDAEAERLRGMENGKKFEVSAVATSARPAPPAEPPPAEPPPADEAEGDDEVDEGSGDEVDEDPDFDSMTKAQIKAHLDEYGVEYDDRMTKAELVELANAL